MDARIQPLPIDPSTLRGLSERLLGSHHADHYGGAAGIDARFLRGGIDAWLAAGRPLVERSDR
jgi:hypothetical protein